MKKAEPVSEITVGTTAVSTVACGLISIILLADGTNEASIKLYDHAASATGDVKKALAIKAASNPEYAVYTPCKSDSFANGIVAVVAGTGAKAYISIEA